ncbi:SH3 domain-containing protein [Maricaulis maris]|uniref:SH3 domain-containing protein n=1 Tax=Maricaulis maris TaxID=74318 RepID=A0A495D217_9PROT|nr:SH3 domain-containing protein [Maricaulis maris]RKQ95568.1 SH3 domain-containing protein [Maricaulis maris]
MRHLIGLLAIVFACGTAQAQPQLYRVVNVDQTDTLNVRATANPTAAIVDTLSPNASRVEVLEERHGWGRVIAGEGEGWINLAYLLRMERPAIGEFDAPGGLQCSGTEPFWGLQLHESGDATYYDGESLGAELALNVVDARTARARPDPHVYYLSGAAEGVAVIASGQCSDGMSDRRYGWQASVDMRSPDGVSRLVQGCCFTPVLQ